MMKDNKSLQKTDVLPGRDGLFPPPAGFYDHQSAQDLRESVQKMAQGSEELSNAAAAKA